jgi:hypothetical protein
VLFTMSGAASSPRVVPVEKVQANFSDATLPVVIWSKVLYRVLA